MNDASMKYVPVFNSNVTVQHGAAAPEAVNPAKCLTEASAQELAAILSAEGSDYQCEIIRDENGAVIGHPITEEPSGGLKKNSDGKWVTDGRGAATSAQVPHFLFTGEGDGQIVNAGDLADYWRPGHHPRNPGDTTDVSLRDAKIAIDQAWNDQIGKQQK